jgi:hypothetical protein
MKEDLVLEQVKTPWKEYCELKDEEVEFPLCEEDEYSSLCVVRDTNHLMNEVIQDELTGAFSEDP